MHLSVEDIQRALHDELLPDEPRTHLAGCGACRGRVEEAREDEARIFSWLGALDQSGRRPTLRAAQAKAARGRRSVPLQWAAAIVLFATLGGAAYALPGSPLRRWIEGWRRGPVLVDPKVSPALPSPPGTDPAGISIMPGDSTVVTFADAQQDGEVRIRLADVSEISVQAPSGGARFDVERAGVTIRNGGSTASYDIVVPHSARHVEIRVSGARVWLKDGTRITSVATAGADGTVHLSLSR